MFCRICGNDNLPEAVFCENCGARIVNVPTDRRNMTYTPEPVYYTAKESDKEFFFEPEPEPENKKVNKVLVAIVVILAVVLCVLIGYFSWVMLSAKSNVSIKGGAEAPVEEIQEEKTEENNENADEKSACKQLVSDIMGAVAQGDDDTVEEHLNFTCADAESLADKIAQELENSIPCAEGDCDDIAQEMADDYFYSMEHDIVQTEDVGGEYIITVNFVRVDIESIIDDILSFDYEEYAQKKEEEFLKSGKITVEMSDEEKDAIIFEACVKKAGEIKNNAMTNNKFREDELEFYVAKDDGEWFILTDKSDFDALEDELKNEE